ncbi:MAG: hypothetical protein HZA88_09210 [Verrucomicrobia bacterium]|nr:hypothetical protein [Verrucomicrobiota bacterium]
MHPMLRFIPIKIALLTAIAAQAAIATQESFPVRLANESWTAQPERVSPSRRAVDHTLRKGDGLEFSMRSRVNESRSMRWSTPSEQTKLSAFRFLVVEYRARGLHRMRSNQEIVSAWVMSGGRAQSVPLMLANETIDDNCWHQLIIKRPFPDNARELMVTLDSRDSRGEFSLRRMLFTNESRDFGPALTAEDTATAPAGEFTTIDLSGRYDTNYDALVTRLLSRSDDPVAQDAGRFFTTSKVCVGRVPFRVRPQGNNLISPPPRPAANEEWINHFGLRVRRGQVAPISRDGATQIAVNLPATEVFLLLAAEMPSQQKAYFVREQPKSLSDVESFAVELRYADGTVDLAFPYSLSDRRHVIQRTLASYVVPASGQPLQSVVLHNRSLHANIYLAALTVHTGSKRWCPQLAEQPPIVAQPPCATPARTPYAIRQENVLQLGNSFIELTTDVSKGFVIRSLRNRWLGEEAVGLTGEPGLEIAVGDARLAPDEMRLVEVRARRSGFELSYTSQNPKVPLDWKILLSVGSTPEVRMELTVTNRGAQTLDANIRFPVVAGLRLGESRDLWYMFPQYCNALDNRPITLYAAAGRNFPMQFFDVFNPRLGGGVYVVTEDRSHKAQRYGLAKDERGTASFFIEHPAQFTHLVPGKPYACCPAVIGVHTGDWHAAAARYQKWLAGWYRPYKSQDKQWYRKSFWLLAEIADGLADDTYKLPAWYDAQTKHLQMHDILAEFERTAGRKPDILHFWSWAYGVEDQVQRWGEYGGRDYDALGGLAAWRAALDDIQQNLKIPVSLYVNATLCNRNTPVGQQLGPRCAMQLPDGRPMIPYPNSYRMCHGTREWTDYMMKLYPRLARDTGASILYVDETASSAMCFAKDHGHDVPLNANAADYHFLKAVREATPGRIPLYGEFPNVDTASQYSDCNINYYFMPSGQQLLGPFFDERPSEHGLSPMPLNIYRYLFPRIAQLDLPLGTRHVSWHDLKFTFFHGEAIYDSYWDLDESKGHAFMVRAYDLKRQYKDCFTSNHPEMLVPTGRDGVCANKFPGRGRTLWTLYNRRYTTVRGPVLAVDHTRGSRYRDAWNDRPLEPELRGGKAILSLPLGPQEIGCVVQER